MARWLLVLVAVLASACSKPSEESSAKKWPAPPPSGEVQIPPELSIAVTVDGAKHAAITAATLKSTKPDFSDAERKAWLIPTLVPDAHDVHTVEASSSAGISMKFRSPTADGVEPVLFLTRRGEVIVSALDPKDPFPGHHGQGGRLHRPGDSMPHLEKVTRLEITQATP